MEEPKQKTEGEKRVRLDFNPNALPRVTEIKTLMAKAIDSLESVEEQIKNAPATLESGPLMASFLRESATAKTEIQKASMCAVLAVTNEITFQLLPARVADAISEVPDHIARVITERKELAEKAKALSTFVNTNVVYGTLPKSKQILMVKQFDIMMLYVKVLTERLALEGYE